MSGHIGNFKLTVEVEGCSQKVRGFVFIDREKQEYYARVDNARHNAFSGASPNAAVVQALGEHLTNNGVFEGAL